MTYELQPLHTQRGCCRGNLSCLVVNPETWWQREISSTTAANGGCHEMAEAAAGAGSATGKAGLSAVFALVDDGLQGRP